MVAFHTIYLYFEAQIIKGKNLHGLTKRLEGSNGSKILWNVLSISTNLLLTNTVSESPSDKTGKLGSIYYTASYFTFSF